MEEKTAAELRKFIGTITDPKIRPFIELTKLCRSGIYKLAVQMATEHAVKHGDFRFLNNLLALLAGTTHANDLIFMVRPKINFIISDTTPPQFKKATPKQVAMSVRLARSASLAKPASKKPIIAKKVTQVPLRKKSEETERPEKTDVSYDILDSRLMLPGSYGSGKKR